MCAQQTDDYTMVEGEVELSTDGAVWTSFAGHASNLEVSGGERTIGEKHTYDGDTPLVNRGKRAKLMVTISMTVGAPGAVPYSTVETAYEAGSDLYARWSPAGGNMGDDRFTTTAGIVENPPYFFGEPDSGEALMYDFAIHVPSIARALVP